ncbi:MAG TPA: CinA family protein [Rhabdochlamydiaceae bacterium]|nr:CinA family protein [Rhabdochlamydiaceae bacterium]
MKAEEAIQKWMIEHKKTLALAESITGGQIAARLTAISGASQYFLGSLVVYSNELKQKVLHVSEQTLKKRGPISREVVKEMAENLIALSGADYGIAITGIAGPTGGSAEKPIGTIWAAIIETGKTPEIWNFNLSGTRAQIIQGAVDQVLSALHRKINSR